MFAFALWDNVRSELHLVRDRLGEKPLYYGWIGDSFVFASELKALYVHPAWNGEIDREALALFLRFGYVPAPHSIFLNVRKLPPAHRIVVRQATDREIVSQPYWNATHFANQPQVDWSGNEAGALAELDRLLRNVVAEQMVSDVPLGAFLSGGIDSSVITALMQTQSARPIRTFTIGFHDRDFDEAQNAKAVAAHLRTDHTELYVTPSEAQSVIHRLPEIYDEPFADVSQIPTYLVAALARQHVTVCLSGDGGDELFGGYYRYSWARQIRRTAGAWPPALRRGVASGLTALAPAQWNVFAKVVGALVGRNRIPRAFGDKVHKLADAFSAGSESELYRELVSLWKKPQDVVIGGSGNVDAMYDTAVADTYIERMMLWDISSYLPDDILVKVDRASMAVSLESRVPLLDRRIVEFALQLPLHMKIRTGKTKWLLRQLLYRYVPSRLVERPKMGFGVPIGDWLRGPLREWAEQYLAEERLLSDGYFQPGPIRQKWTEHLSGERNWQYSLWTVLMFQAWLERTRTTRPSSIAVS